MKYTIIPIFLVVMTSSIAAQSEVTKDRELHVEKNYNNEIYAVHPIFDFANIHVASPQPTVQLSNDSMVGAPEYTPNINLQIRPIVYTSPTSPKGHKGMIKIDKGTINPWHVQTGYVYNSPNYFTIYGSGNYDKWQQSEVLDQHATDITGSIGATYYLTSESKISLDVKYNNRKYGLYARQDKHSEPQGLYNHFKDFGVRLGIETFRTMPSQWNYRMQIKVQNWNENILNGKETNIDAQPYVEFKVSNKYKLWATPTYSISKSEKYNNGALFQNILASTLDFSAARISVGVNMTHYSDNWSIWPSAHIDWQISNNQQFILRATQEVNILTGAGTSTINPLIDLQSLADLSSHIDNFKRYQRTRAIEAEYTADILTDLTLSLMTQYKMVQGDLNYHLLDVGKSLALSQVDYDQLHIGIQGRFKLLNGNAQVAMGVEYNRFENESLPLLHRPTWIFTPEASALLLNHKLELNLNTAINTPQLLSINNGEEIQSRWRTNIGIAAKYEIMPKINAYINADNIIDTDYQVWDGYNNFGRNLSVGVLIKL